MQAGDLIFTILSIGLKWVDREILTGHNFQK